METLEAVEEPPSTLAITCAGPPVAAGVWTDHLGTVHERLAEAKHHTRCGMVAGIDDDGRPLRGCRDCANHSLDEFARTHDCASAGCAPA